MIGILVGNSYSKISGLTAKQHKELADALSYVIGGSSAYFASGFRPRRRSLLDKAGNFPTGLLRRLTTYLNINGKIYKIRDARVQPSYTGTNIPGLEIYEPYQSQVDAVTAAIDNKRGIISMPTGTGKSRVIKMICQTINLRTLVIVPSLEIKRQLQDILGSYPKVDIQNIDSPFLKEANHYDVLIIDEAHHSAAKTYRTLNKKYWNNIYYRFFLTATPFRNDTEETLLFESIAGQVIYKLDYKTAIDKGYIIPIEAYYFDMPKQNTNAHTYREVYDELVVKNDYRNIVIAKLSKQLQENGVYTLILVREIDHGNELSALTGIPFVSGADDGSRDYIRQFNSGEVKAIIGTTGVLGEGVDTKPAEYVIIAGLGKAKSQFMQQVGRGVRCYPGKESAKIILFKDKSHKFLTRHFKSQSDILKDEYGIVPVKLVF